MGGDLERAIHLYHAGRIWILDPECMQSGFDIGMLLPGFPRACQSMTEGATTPDGKDPPDGTANSQLRSPRDMRLASPTVSRRPAMAWAISFVRATLAPFAGPRPITSPAAPYCPTQTSADVSLAQRLDLPKSLPETHLHPAASRGCECSSAVLLPLACSSKC